ncbi:MAG: Coenzyme F420 hydrogenase/dehydrogenase, beta subunit C-terminal domain [Nitrososphaerota archaeon]|jgi:coenzyme F420 hydrogenase subunit beta|nr:Coenzyme F420 hydrogenase/dehydrogenase, beta subunit C-terminal domain [Nitrososphaerota archaeon]
MAAEQPENIQNRRAEDEKKREQQFLDGVKDKELGIYCDLFSAKSQIEGQDGGIVTALLLKGMREGLFDIAIVVRRKDGYNADVVAAETAEEVLAAKGTIYYRVAVTKKLRELLAQGKNRIAVVCTPCEVAAIRKIQQTIGKDIEITVIGLFCFGAFNPQKLKGEIKARLGVDLDKATKVQIKQGKFIMLIEGRAVSCKINDFEGATEMVCGFCSDFVSRLADVSVGSATNKAGYSTVIVRSKKGTRLVSGLDAERDVADSQGITKIAQFKRKHAKKR